MRKFKTESKKLLDLMINSIYTNREIFLRELISNASDAEDKLYFKSLTDSSIQLGKSDLTIRIDYDPAARTVAVVDNGIGMDKDALDANLGVIAHSDSLLFKTTQASGAADTQAAAEDAEPAPGEGATATGDIDIIGQFGVGFYSAFMVAKRVRVESRAWGDEQAWAWESDGVEGYTIEPCEKEGNGTTVTLFLKDNTEDDNYDTFCSEWSLRDLIRRYSNYVRYPVQMLVTKSREKERPEDAPEDYQPEYEQYTELETINSMTPIWKRRKSDVTDEDYAEFYKSQFHDFSDPLRTISVHAEGALSYDVLAFIPSRRPFDLYSRDYEKGLQLYSSNVLIMEKCPELVPDYYNFVRGVVASPDLTLNISRETLQHNNQLSAIARRVEKKITQELESMRDNAREDYEAFFDNFGRGLKYGIYMSYGANKAELAPLLLFYSAAQEKLVTLDEYVEAMPEDQTAIYYAAGESTSRLARMPKVASVRGRGYDVLLCTQDVDEFCLQAMMNYAEKDLKNVADGNLGLETESDKEAAEAATAANDALLWAMKDALGESVVRVAIDPVLTDAPAALAADGPVSLEMEKVLAGMPDADGVRAGRVLQLNPNHAVFGVLAAAQDSGDTEKVAAYTKLLYNQALLVEGLPIDDPVAFAQDIAALMV